jgi:hypothetical protein
MPASANGSSHRSQDGQDDADDEQDRADDEQEMDAGDKQSDDEQDDAESDQRVSGGRGLAKRRGVCPMSQRRASEKVRAQTYSAPADRRPREFSGMSPFQPLGLQGCGGYRPMADRGPIKVMVCP